MRPQIATSIEQSRRLLTCGVDPETADMCWTQRTHRIDGTPIKKSHQKANLWLGYPCKRYLEDDEQRIDTPAWSLSALLGLLPPQFKPSWPEFDFCLQLRRTTNGKWEIAYDHTFEADSPIEACVKMFETLAELCYPLNKIEE